MSLPGRMVELLRLGAGGNGRFPPTEVFNEGWMLRLVLDAAQQLAVRDPVLAFAEGADWYSEARMMSPFAPRWRGDPLGEGQTNADAVVGHFAFGETRAGLRLTAAEHGQFKVIEAKMASNLASGTTRAKGYDQAARNVACIAEAIRLSGRPLEDFEDVGFYVVAPALDKRATRDTNIEQLLAPASIRAVVNQRIEGYEAAGRTEAGELRVWEQAYFLPLIERLVAFNALRFVSWERLIEIIREHDAATGEELSEFYARCLVHNSLDPAR